jgi:hypothetical protein
MRIYWAAPLFNLAEIAFNKAMVEKLTGMGHVVFLPQENEPREASASAIFDADVAGIDASEVVVAILDGADPDSGTSWECGYAFKHRPILAVRTDFRSGDDPDLGPCNLMLWLSASRRLRALNPSSIDLDSLAREIDKVLVGIVKLTDNTSTTGGRSE